MSEPNSPFPDRAFSVGHASMYRPQTAQDAPINSTQAGKVERRWKQYVRTHHFLGLPEEPSKIMEQKPRKRGLFSSLSDSKAELIPPETKSLVREGNTLFPPHQGKVVPYYLNIKKITGVRIPDELLEIHKRTEMHYRIQISLFHEPTKTFFGRTWSSEAKRVPTSAKHGIAMGPQHIYFRSAIHDESCFAVLELVLEVHKHGAVAERYAVGWTTLSVFSRGSSLMDVSRATLDDDGGRRNDDDENEDGAEDGEKSKRSRRRRGRMSDGDDDYDDDDGATEYKSRRDVTDLASPYTMKGRKLMEQSGKKGRKSKAVARPFYAGTPRALVVVDSKTDWRRTVRPATGLRLWYQLYGHKKLNSIAHLFRENELISPKDIVGGLPLPGLRLPANPQSPLFDDLLSDDVPRFSLAIIAPAVTLPLGFEKKLIDNMGFIREHRWQDLPDDEHYIGTIVARRLKVGIHNGRTFIREPGVITMDALPVRGTGVGENGRPGSSPSRSRPNSRGSTRGGEGSPDSPLRKRADMGTRLEFEGEYWIRDLVCNPHDPNDRLLSVVMSLEYLVQWICPDSRNPPETSVINVGWAPRVVSSPGISFDGSRTRIELERGPSNTADHALVYGGDVLIHEESKNLELGLYPEQEKVFLDVGLLSPQIEQGDTRMVSPPMSPIPQHFDHDETTESEAVMAVPDQRPKPNARNRPRTPPPPMRTPTERSSNVNMAIQTPSRMLNAAHELRNEPVSSIRQSAKGREHIDLNRELDDPYQYSDFFFKICGFSVPHFRQRKSKHQSLQVTFRFFTRDAYTSPLIKLGEYQQGHAGIMDGASSRAHMADQLQRSARIEPDVIHKSPVNLELLADDQYHHYAFALTYRCKTRPEEHKNLINYLYQNDLLIDVWDGESLMHLGTARVPLHLYLRQRKENIQRLDVVNVYKNSALGGSFFAESGPEATDVGAAYAPHLFQGLDDAGDLLGNKLEGSFVGNLHIAVSHMGREVAEQDKDQVDFLLSRALPSSADESLLLSPDKLPKYKSRKPHPLNIPVNEATSRSRKVKGHTLVEMNPQLRQELRGPSALADAKYRPKQGSSKALVGTSGIIHRPKLRSKMEPIRKPQMKTESKELTEKRVDDLLKMKQFRESRKGLTIERLMRSNMVSSRTVYASYGKMVFFELRFTNPFDSKSHFFVEIDDPCQRSFSRRSGSGDDASPDRRRSERQNSKRNRKERREDEVRSVPELQMVTSEEEWVFYKREFGVSTPVRRRLFVSEDQISLAGSESALLPFKFQSFRCGDHDDTSVFPRVAGARVGPQYERIESRTIKIKVMSAQRKTLAVLEVSIHPQQFSVERVFRLHHWGNEVMKHTIQLPPPRFEVVGAAGAAAQQEILPVERGRTVRMSEGDNRAANLAVRHERKVCRVQCSSDQVALEFRDPLRNIHTTQEPQNAQVADVTHLNSQNIPAIDASQSRLMVRCRVDSFPSVNRFFLLLYTDPYNCHLHSVYEVHVHGHQRADMPVLVGQETRGNLYMPATRERRNVRCFCSRPEDFSFGSNGTYGDPSQVFTLRPDQVNQLSYKFLTSLGGSRKQLIFLVDTDTGALVHSWLLYVTATYPQVDREYHVDIFVGQGSRKKLDYTNNYNNAKRFLVTSSDPAKIKVVHDTLSMDALEKSEIELLFEPVEASGSDVVFLFVNDESGKNEECLKFNLNYMM